MTIGSKGVQPRISWPEVLCKKGVFEENGTGFNTSVGEEGIFQMKAHLKKTIPEQIHADVTTLYFLFY